MRLMALEKERRDDLCFPFPSLNHSYCVVAKESAGKQLPIAFLDRVKADFKKRYGGGKADTAMAKSLNKEFGPIMKEHMKYIADHAEDSDKLLKVKAQVIEVKEIMMNNIDQGYLYSALTICIYGSLYMHSPDD
uniref:Longin domain-containing protein n=1 Tax=Fagus sylvatica TaxID=28930 RepID=A0A2N9IBL0_FAGSY